MKSSSLLGRKHFGIRFALLVSVSAALIAGQTTIGEDERSKNVKNPTADSESVAVAIKSILAKQAGAWNRGDLDDFMEHYWKSDKLTFSSGGKTTRGWSTTKANYKRRYPTRERMGKLTFDRLEVIQLGKSAALTLGHWQLQRQPEPVGGNFSLVFRRIDGRWVIIHDHTSRAEQPAPE